MVDSVYTAETLAMMPRLAGAGSVVCWHTGGVFDAVAAAPAEVSR